MDSYDSLADGLRNEVDFHRARKRRRLLRRLVYKVTNVESTLFYNVLLQLSQWRVFICRTSGLDRGCCFGCECRLQASCIQVHAKHRNHLNSLFPFPTLL